MASESDIAVNISCDLDEFTAPLDGAMDQMEQMTTVVHLQETSWTSLGVSVLSAIGNIAGPALSLVATYKKMQAATLAFAAANVVATPPTLTLGAAVNFLLSPIVLVTAALATVAAAVYYFSQSEEDATAATQSVSESVDDAVSSMGILAEAAVSAKNALLTDETVQSLTEVQGEVSKLSASYAELRASIEQPFRDGANSIAAYVASFVGMESMTEVAASALRGLNKTVDRLKDAVSTAKVTFGASFLAFAAGMSGAEAEDFVRTNQAMHEQAKASEELTAKLEEQRSSFQRLAEIQATAAANAANAAEIDQVRSLFTIEGVENEIRALQEKSAETILAKENDEEWEKQTAALFDALERQRQGILNGTIVDKAAEQAKRDLAKAEEEAARAAKKAAEDEANRQKSFEDRISSMKEEIAVLNGSATEAEVAMGQLWKQGFSEEQINEIMRLQEELNSLKGNKNKPEDKIRQDRFDTRNAALQIGSQEAVAAINAAVSGASQDAMQQKQLNALDQIADNTQRAIDLAQQRADSGVEVVAGSLSA